MSYSFLHSPFALSLKDCNEERNQMALQPSEKLGELPPEFHIEGSSEGLASKASEDCRKTIGEVHEESSVGVVNLPEDLHRWRKQQHIRRSNKVLPRAEVIENYRSLFEAALKGDWRTTEKILHEDSAAITAYVMTVESNGCTVLEVAIMAEQDHLVENLIKHFSKYLNPSRALCYAARGGRIRIVKTLIDKIDDDPNTIASALDHAVRFSPMQKEAIWYLAKRTTVMPNELAWSFFIYSGHLDILFYLARKFPGTLGDRGEDFGSVSFLEFFVTMTPYFRSGANLNFWQKSIYKCIPLCLVDTLFDNSKDTKMARALNRLKISVWNLVIRSVPFIKKCGELKLRHHYLLELAKQALMEMESDIGTPKMLEFLLTTGVVLDGASRGIFELLDLCLKKFPELMWDDNFAKELMKKVVEGRHIELFRLVNTHNPIRYLAKDVFINLDLMNAVTEWSSKCVSLDVSGAAFLLQRELQWFHVVEVSSFPSFKWLKYQEHKSTYWEVFVQQRQELLKDARQWMKDTSTSCSLVGTLIITIAFAAAFVVPGGSDNNMGIPKLLKNDSFMVFTVANSLALFYSVTATLMFLVILTSCYAIEDFLHSLPRKMILGLTFLFLSLIFMLVAFGSALTIVLSEQWKWIYIPITLLASLPIVLFTILQLPLYVEMVKSTCWPRLYRPLKLWK